eukprot:TRINITY_DN13784_c0_g1_i1.p1 TRINITY_DN13784_c0_g1~~TRINITY_DN13784_c0_g1_i1.p1  ORF type:complete len:111 (+),score=12.40 TRINITY_DN13784_c0_g1_i1:43-333(+)
MAKLIKLVRGEFGPISIFKHEPERMQRAKLKRIRKPRREPPVEPKRENEDEEQSRCSEKNRLIEQKAAEYDKLKAAFVKHGFKLSNKNRASYPFKV